MFTKFSFIDTNQFPLVI